MGTKGEAPRITVIGSNMMDLITYMERMPHPGETIEAPDFELGFGGKGANQAVAAAQLGAEVTMVTRVGDDMFGDEVIKNFASYGIDTSHIEKVAGESSGVAPIFVDQTGENRIFIIKGANSHLLPGVVEDSESLIAESDMILLQLEIPLETVYRAIELAGKHDTISLLNPAPMQPDLSLERLAGLDYFIPNESELSTFTGNDIEGHNMDELRRAADTLISADIKNVIITLGAEGTYLVNEEEDKLIPAPDVKPVDTTGAGDAFIGSLAYFRHSHNLSRALKLANRYAALTTTRRGTQKSYVTGEEFRKKSDLTK